MSIVYSIEYSLKRTYKSLYSVFIEALHKSLTQTNRGLFLTNPPGSQLHPAVHVLSPLSMHTVKSK